MEVIEIPLKELRLIAVILFSGICTSFPWGRFPIIASSVTVISHFSVLILIIMPTSSVTLPTIVIEPYYISGLKNSPKKKEKKSAKRSIEGTHENTSYL